MLLDLDRFKSINDARGHVAGDRVLAVVSRRIETAVREDAMVARLGGDDLVVLCDTAQYAAKRFGGDTVVRHSAQLASKRAQSA